VAYNMTFQEVEDMEVDPLTGRGFIRVGDHKTSEVQVAGVHVPPRDVPLFQAYLKYVRPTVADANSPPTFFLSNT
jgi:hypothetical protein